MRSPIARTCLAALALLAATATGPATAQQDPADVVMVLDASGSMWGRVEDRYKIEIAREVLADLLADWTPSVRLGLIAYGHRSDDDCSDIETVVPVGQVDPDAVMATVNRLQPRGRTPLTDALRLAAETIGYRERPATVILLSDGVETCGGDPCAVAAEMERAGVDLTAHVIGFDVLDPADQARLSCIAESTGGEFHTAGTADELSDALAAVGASVSEPEPAPAPARADVTVEPPDPVAGSEVTVHWQGPDAEGDYIALVAPGAPDMSFGVYAYTRDGNPLTLRAPEDPGSYEARYVSGPERSVLARAPFTVTVAAVTLDAPDAVDAGARFQVSWVGPDDHRDYVTIVQAGAAQGEYGNYTRTERGNPLTVRAPDQPGQYELRYNTGQSGETLAAVPIVVRETSASLDAPEAVDAGADVQVAWTGPDNDRDYVTIVEAGAAQGEYGNYTRTERGNPLTVRAPDEPGQYELRYNTGQSGETLAAVPIVVRETTASLDAPEAVDAGADVQVAWTGPDNDRDYVTIVEAGAAQGEYGNYTRTERGNPLTVRAPDQPGQYELRYNTGQSGETLAAVPIVVRETTASLDAPEAVDAGADVQVTWTGPDNDRDYVTIVEAGAAQGEYGNYTRTERGNPLTVRAPDEPGQYELRYNTGQSGETLAAVPIVVRETTASLDAPEAVDAGADVQVAWTGPDNQRDYITIVEAGAAQGEYGNYTRTERGNPLTIRAPDEPGQYELRYNTGQSGETLAAVPVTVREVTATVQAPPIIAAGTEFSVRWTGPDHHRDYITIVEADAGAGEYGNYTRTDRGNPLTLAAPESPGAYEIRYNTGQSGRTLARQPVTVE